MSYNREDFRKIMNTYPEKAARAFSLAEDRKAELHKKFPVLIDIDNVISRMPLNILQEAGLGSENLDARLEALKKEYYAILKKRAEFLNSNGFPSDYSDVKYECEKCHDTGYEGINLCDCAKKQLVIEGYKSSGIYKLLKTQSFDNFLLDRFKSPDDCKNIKKIFDYSKNYAENFSPDKSSSLFFLGDTGLGKTHISTSIAKVVINKGYSVTYDTAPNMMTRLEREHFSYNNSNSVEEAYINCDLLIIDDLGAEYTNRANVSLLYNIVNTRLLNESPIIISTNLSPSDIEKKYERRMASRFLGEFDVFAFTGEDMRRLKLSNK